MNQYEVSWTEEGSGIFHVNIVRTEKSPVEVGLWYKKKNPRVRVGGIRLASASSTKPGMPVVKI